MSEITEKDITLLFSMAKLIIPKMQEFIQLYSSSEKRIGTVIKYVKNNKIIAIWFDVEKLSERDLKYIFKHHKQSNKKFFINYNVDFYRIGFKL